MDRIHFINHVDELIKNGKIRQSQIELKKLKRAEVPVKDWYIMANLARRAQMPLMVLKWLSPIVRAKTEYFKSFEEPKLRSLYANALTRIGGFKEAKELLNSISPSDDSQVHFYKSLLNLQQWDHRQAIVNLKTYLKTSNLSQYSIKIGKLNLAAAYTGEGLYIEALTVINDLILSLDKGSLLYANCLEVQGQCLFQLKRFDEAENTLKNSLSSFGKQNHSYKFYAQKWLLFTKIFSKNGIDKESIQELSQFKKSALENFQWEVVRDCDYYLSFITKNEELFLKVYLGTRFKKYKENIKNHYGYKKRIPKLKSILITPHLELNVGSLLKSEKLVFHFHQGEFYFGENKKIQLYDLPLKLFQILITDQYQPFQFGELYFHLYPDEYFNPESSPAKLNRIIQRLRNEITAIPLKIVQKNDRVWLDYQSPLQVEFNTKNNFHRYFEEYRELKERFKTQYFNSREASEVFNKSIKTTQRVLSQLVEKKHIKCSQDGPKTKYKIIK